MNSGEFTLHSQDSQRAQGMPGNPGYMISSREGVANEAFQGDAEARSHTDARASHENKTSLDLSQYDVEECPAGTHSLLHAFWMAAAEHDSDIKMSDVQDALRTELSFNHAQYAGLTGGLAKSAIWQKLSAFLDEGKSDRDIALVAPQALANALSLKVRLLHVEAATPAAVAAAAGAADHAVGDEEEKVWVLRSNHELNGRVRPGARNRAVALAHTDDEHYFYLRPKRSRYDSLPNGHVEVDSARADGDAGGSELGSPHVMPTRAADAPDEAQTYRDPEEPDKPKWDVFRMKDEDQYHASADQFWTTFRKVFRVLTLVFTFLLVLSSTVGSKLAVLVITGNMASMSHKGKGLTCKCESGACSLSIVDSPVNSSKVQQSRNGDDGSREDDGSLKDDPFTLSERATLLWGWVLVFAVTTPYIFTFLKSLWHLIGCQKPRWYGCGFLLGVLVVEFVHTAGVVMLMVFVLPSLDLLRGTAVMLGVGIVPAALKMFSHSSAYESVPWARLGLDVVTFLVQLSLPVAFILRTESSGHSDFWSHGAFFSSVVLVSVRWWPNYINRFTACCAPIRDFANGLNTTQFNQRNDTGERRVSYKKKVARNNHLLHLIISVWKTLLTTLGIVGSVVLKTAAVNKDGVVVYQDFFFSTSSLLPYCERSYDDETNVETPISIDYSPFVVLAMQVGCGIVCYFVGLHACKVHLQKSGFALPLALTTPAVVLISLLLASTVDTRGFTASTGIILNLDNLKLFDTSVHTAEAILIGATLLWWLSQMRIASHVWFPKVSRISASERLFLNPVFDTEILEQAMLYNRKNDLDSERTSAELRQERERRASRFSTRISVVNGELEQVDSTQQRDPNVDFIYLCATMWHESEDEMKQILKSIYRLDRDQNWRKNAQEFFNVSDPDYYEFEAHIFFDDAFTEHYENGTQYSVNSYVKKLVEVVPTAASAVHKINVKILDPVRIPTPYGGRLEWTLPGGNRLIAHLKDKMKIRHKKRWSQVMYMYYFLGYRIIASSDYTKNQKETMAHKTYLLALDGDVDFQPQAVQLLVDMMKRNEDVGAACGRIHPVGSGLIVWYQKFEYAVSHWLQKATEHILGCVLCSPGCFSLFRGSALMDDNVMRRYATPSTEASHYLQFDQGEDRWLCTLLLQRGYRVEYNAAADALTNAPEGFNEFYNQRRRWGPSTMANILDLLMDVRHVVKVNKYMSLLYIAYQAMMFFASLLGPGTIFLMITGALGLVLRQGDDLPFIINVVPIVFYIIISYFTSDSFQLKVASLLSALYALVMGLVMVSVAIELNKNICSSSSIFFMVVSGTFLLAAILHPQEFKDVIFGIVYYLLIPCMYLFLIIYSMVNMNNVSWGTREVKPSTAPVQEVKVQQQSPQSLQGMIMSFIKKTDQSAEDDGATYSCGSACKIVCCPRPNKSEDGKWVLLTNQMRKMTERMKSMATDMKLIRRKVNSGRPLDTESDSESEIGFTDQPGKASDAQPLLEHPPPPPASAHAAQTSERAGAADQDSAEKPALEIRDDLMNPYWIEEAELLSGPIEYLDDDETLFWKQLTASYLKPLDNNPQQQKMVKEQLLELRNKVTFGFFLANAMFVVVVFTLQKQKNEISVEWPCVTSGEQQKEKVDPIGISFLFFFVLVMILQVIGMLFHRLGTFFHIMATTTLTLCKRLSPENKEQEMSEHNARAILAMAQNMAVTNKKMSDGGMSDMEFGTLQRKQNKLVHRILDTLAEPAVVSLDDEFRRNVENIDGDLESERLDENHRFLHNLPARQQRATINFLRDQRTIASMRRRLSQNSAITRLEGGRGSTGSRPSPRGRRSNTVGNDPRRSSAGSGVASLQRHRASVAFEDDQQASVSRCYTLPSVLAQRYEDGAAERAKAPEAVANSDGAAAAAANAEAAAARGSVETLGRRFSEVIPVRNMSTVMEDDEDEVEEDTIM